MYFRLLIFSLCKKQSRAFQKNENIYSCLPEMISETRSIFKPELIFSLACRSTKEMPRVKRTAYIKMNLALFKASHIEFHVCIRSS